jgi:hypothetical protein
MPQRPTLDSFIVRIYEVDPKDRRKIEGTVESMDGSGEHESFVSIDELSTALNRACLRGDEKDAEDGGA